MNKEIKFLRVANKEEYKEIIRLTKQSLEMKRTKKLDALAIEYIEPSLYRDLYDCSDSMRESEKIEQRFLALCDDKYNIKEYIYKFYLNEYIAAIFDAAEQNGEEVTKENFSDFLDGTPTKFPENIKLYFQTVK